MADGVKFQNIVSALALMLGKDYIVGTRKNDNGSYTDLKFPLQLIVDILNGTSSVIVKLTADSNTIQHPSLIGANNIFITSLGGSRLRDNSIDVWDNATQSVIVIADDLNGYDDFNPTNGLITLSSTHASGEIFIIDYN